jgi:chromosomal replication initiator protein
MQPEGLKLEVWIDILSQLRMTHPQLWRAWFPNLQPLSLIGGVLTIATANEAQLAYLTDNCTPAFIDAAQTAIGRLVSTHFVVKDPASTPIFAPAVPAPHSKSDDAPEPLNPGFTFTNFGVGPSNRLAHASAIAVSESPGTTYNPLFIHGGAATGKTHLLQAIYHALRESKPTISACYLTCEKFVAGFLSAIESRTLEEFQQHYRQSDVLIVDDIQRLSNHERTREEFYHTFNALLQSQRQIILSADQAPDGIPGIEERLVSRFKSGLVVRIDAPDDATRLAIAQIKSRLTGTPEPQRAADIDPPAKPIRVQDIMVVVTERFGVGVADLTGRQRSPSVALPRQVCMYLARQHTQHSLEEIGGFFGGRDHTTVLHANKLIAQRRHDDPTFRRRLEEMEHTLRGV